MESIKRYSSNIYEIQQLSKYDGEWGLESSIFILLSNDCEELNKIVGRLTNEQLCKSAIIETTNPNVFDNYKFIAKLYEIDWEYRQILIADLIENKRLARGKKSLSKYLEDTITQYLERTISKSIKWDDFFPY